MAIDTVRTAVLAAVPQIVADCRHTGQLSVIQDSYVAAAVAAVASRAAYVTQLATAYPTRGYA